MSKTARSPVAEASTHMECLLASLGELDGGEALVPLVHKEIEEREYSERLLRETNQRLELLVDVTSELLRSDQPQRVVDRLGHKVLAFLDAHIFLNYLADHERQRLHLNACGGLPNELVAKLEWLDYGVAVCGCVAQQGRPIVVENLQESQDPRDQLIKSLGLKAYACHPLMAQGRVLGTLGFGSRSRSRFGPHELSLMNAVADQIAIAIQRLESQMALRQSEEAAQRAKEAAERANQTKDQFLAVLSHELRTPLTPALARLDLVQREANLPDGVRESLESIRRNIQLEARLIGDLLDVTGLVQGKLELHLRSVDAHREIEAAADIFEQEIKAKALRLEMDLRAEQHHVQADPVRLRQVFWNLISNAVKYTPPQGQITIRSSNMAEGLLTVEVIDTGIGIAPETMQRLFTAFEQGEQTLTRRFGGLGLGLSIARSLMERQGGSLRAYSEGKGNGSVFTVEMKTSVPPAAQTGAVRPVEPGQRRSVSILLVEDNEETLRVISRLLKTFGHRVKTAATVHDAMEAAKEKPELIISDIGLPDGTGWDLIRAVRQQQAVRGIALSGFGSSDDLQKSKAAGFLTHMVKPVNPDDLEAAIQQAVAKA